MAHMVKKLPAVWETWVWSLGWEDPLEEGLAAHSNILAWRISWMEEPGRLQSMASQRVGHDWPQKQQHTYMWGFLAAQMVKSLPAMQETWVWSLGWENPWRRAWQPTLVFLLGEFHGQRSLEGYNPWGHKESDTTEWLTHTHTHIYTHTHILWSN